MKNWKRVIAAVAKDSVADLDTTNTKPCSSKHRCAFMQAAIDSKGSLGEVFSFRGESSVAFHRKAKGRKRPPFLILNVCPWCEEKL